MRRLMHVGKMKKINQYQANHNLGPDPAGSGGVMHLLRIGIIIVILLFVLWLWP